MQSDWSRSYLLWDYHSCRKSPGLTACLVVDEVHPIVVVLLGCSAQIELVETWIREKLAYAWKRGKIIENRFLEVHQDDNSRFLILNIWVMARGTKCWGSHLCSKRISLVFVETPEMVLPVLQPEPFLSRSSCLAVCVYLQDPIFPCTESECGCSSALWLSHSPQLAVIELHSRYATCFLYVLQFQAVFHSGSRLVRGEWNGKCTLHAVLVILSPSDWKFLKEFFLCHSS